MIAKHKQLARLPDSSAFIHQGASYVNEESISRVSEARWNPASGLAEGVNAVDFMDEVDTHGVHPVSCGAFRYA